MKTKFVLFLVSCFFSQFLFAQVELKPDSSTFESKVTINNSFENNGLKYPMLDGTDGQVLTTDGVGNLGWQDAASGGGEDYSSYFECDCDAPPNDYIIGVTYESYEECGNLFDSGGAGGNYSNNEYEEFLIRRDVDAVYTKLTINYFDTEENRDSLIIISGDFETGVTKKYLFKLDINSPDTLQFSARNDIYIQFYSDDFNTAPGFDITWSKLKYIPDTYENEEMFGFFFDPEKQAVGGGVEQNNAWDDIGFNGVLFGNSGQASAEKSVSLGNSNSALGIKSSAIGYGNIAYEYQVSIFDGARGNNAFGSYNKVEENRSSAFGYSNRATGDESSAFGSSNIATENFTSAFGYANDATGLKSSAFGQGNDATGYESSAFGYNNDAEGVRSSAYGYNNHAKGGASSAFGYANGAIGNFGSAFGANCISNIYRLTVVGTYNDTILGSKTSWGYTEPVFMVGNGQGSASRSTALTILQNGNTGIGTMSPSEKLQVEGTLRIQNGTSAILKFNQSNGTAIGELRGNQNDMILENKIPTVGRIFYRVKDSHQFQTGTNNNVRMIIQDDGDVGIGITNPTYDLQLGANLAAKPGSSTWAIASDKRLKKNIKPFTDGLEILKRIKPVWYNYNGKARLPSDEQFVGIIAQDMQKIAPYTIQDYEVEVENGRNEKYLGFDANALFYITINAVKEQQVIIDNLKQENLQQREEIEELHTLKAEVAALQNLVNQLIDNKSNKSESNDLELLLQKKAFLGQNQPNPFHQNTTVEYFLPKIIQKASLQVTSVDGKVLGTVPITQVGKGQVTIKASAYPAGTYFYSLIVDGQVLETKRMVLTR